MRPDMWRRPQRRDGPNLRAAKPCVRPPVVLPRAADLMELNLAKNEGKSYDHDAYSKRLQSAVNEVVLKQVFQ